MKSDELVKAESKNTLFENRWSGFLDLSSILKLDICSHYPDFGLVKYKILFDRLIFPRGSLSTSNRILHILFCSIGSAKNSDFKPNHFAPVILKTNCFVNDKISSPPKKFKGSSILSYFQKKGTYIEPLLPFLPQIKFFLPPVILLKLIIPHLRYRLLQ